MEKILWDFYAKGPNGVIAIPEAKINEFNNRQYDIFWAVQEFEPRGLRKIENLKKIRFIAADFDNIDLPTFMGKFKNYLYPSFIISTRSGLQPYWRLKEPIDSVGMHEFYKDFIEKALIPLGADPNAKDACRMLRVPFMRYWRDSKGNFYNKKEIYCDIVYEDPDNPVYDLDLLKDCFIKKTFKSKEKYLKPISKKAFGAPTDNKNFWYKANQLDPETSLNRLSGTEWVSMEKFTFLPQRDGTKRILIDGKKRNTWLDKDGFIGSTSDGGPAIPNWLFYYHKDWGKVVSILKEAFPELGE